MEFSDEDLRKISPILSKSMFFTMASSCKTEAQKKSMLMLEFLYLSRHKQTVRRYFGGSAAEGTAIKTSDVDKMIVGPNIYVCSEQADGEQVKGHVFLMDASDSSPGHTKLVLLKTDPNIPTVFDQGNTLYDMLEETQDGRRLLSSEKVVTFWMDFMRKRQTSTGPPETFRHGPCATTVTTDPQGYIKNEIGGVIEQDFAHGLLFCSPPSMGKDWLRNRVNFSWPSQKIVQKIMSLKCHVVAVGDKMSQHSSLEWRISYLLWERELVWSFNDIQLQCYVLLKALLKKYIDPVAPDELSSYHMKTIVFWESEDTEENCWGQEFLIPFLRNCLWRLSECVLNRSLKHFIERDKNLLLGKMCEIEIKESVLKVIKDIIPDIITYSLKCIDGIDLTTTWQKSDHNIETFLRKCLACHNSRITFDFNDSKLPVKVYHYERAYAIGVNAETVLADFSTLAQYHVSLEECDRDIEVDDKFKRSVKMFIHMRSAMILARQLLSSKNNAAASETIQKLMNFMEENSALDVISGKLYVVTCLLAFDKREEASRELQNIASSIRNASVLIYTGMCSSCEIMRPSGETLIQEKRIPPCSSSQMEFLSVAHDAIFAQEDCPVLPDALKYECMVDRAFLLHPAVYFFYLRCLCRKTQEKMEDIARLHAVVNDCNGTLHSYRSFNILGHCYFENGNFQSAFDCYATSFSQTVQSGRPNVAIYMLLVILLNIFQTQGSENLR
ncbi:uncharacterized protein LOC130053121 isoform X2 [Ostrea edulis]|uniref:uncharacterized protein LOC130053121 isoform X2 n=1 Tax=Ostrea edulis TaxID=37623 RepID=UPI0024AE9984|nr:uncharacterized protein LOC130053121 isoform X2 [Ostrea edulis]